MLKFFTSQVGDTNTISTQDKNLNINLNSEIPVFGDFKIHDDTVIIWILLCIIAKERIVYSNIKLSFHQKDRLPYKFVCSIYILCYSKQDTKVGGFCCTKIKTLRI